MSHSNTNDQHQHTILPSEDHVKSLSLQLIDALNTRNFREVATRHMLPNFSGSEVDDYRHTVTVRDGSIEFVTGYLDENPNFHTEVSQINAEVDEKLGDAKVWISRIDTGLTEGKPRECVMLLTWIRKGNDWFCTGYEGMRSFPFYTSDELWHEKA